MSKCDIRLSSAKSLIESRPDSALSILDSISSDRPGHNKALIHYLKGKARLNMLNYPAAMEEFLHAEKISDETSDDSVLALSRLSMMDISDSVGDYNEKTYYALKACETYEHARDFGNIYNTLDRLSYIHTSDLSPEYTSRLIHYASLIKNIDSCVVNGEDTIKISGKHLYNFIQMSCDMNTTEIPIGIALKSFNLQEYLELIKTHGDWRQTITNDSTIISYYNANLITSSLWRQGYDNEARDFIMYYRSHYKDKKLAYDIHPVTNRLTGNIVSYDQSDVSPSFMKTFHDNIKSTMTKFHYEEEIIHARTIKFQRAMLITISALSITIIIAIGLYLRIVNMRRRRINDSNMRTAAELKTTLNNLEDMHIKTLSNLCNTYYDCYNKESVKSKIAKEALLTINSIAEADDFLPKLEARLNESADNLMTHLRNEMTDLKDSDRNLFICNAIGLTIPAICLLLKEKRDVIYTRRLRLRNKIQEAATPHAELFLKYLR